MIEFHQTPMGVKFFEATLPNIAHQLSRLAAVGEKLVEFQTTSPEEDPLTQKDNQFEAEYMAIDNFVHEYLPEDYKQYEHAGMSLSCCIENLLLELNDRRTDSGNKMFKDATRKKG